MGEAPWRGAVTGGTSWGLTERDLVQTWGSKRGMADPDLGLTEGDLVQT